MPDIIKVLWISDILFPEICQELEIKSRPIGGWIRSYAMSVVKDEHIKLAIASPYNGTVLKIIEKNNIIHYLFPYTKSIWKYDSKLEIVFKEIQSIFNPNIVHIHGTEYSYGLAYINSCGSKNVVASIQGLANVYKDYYYAGMTFFDVLKNTTLRDIVKNKTIFHGYYSMKKRGINEINTIKRLENIIGRTTWDKVHVKAHNSKIKYHFCNENLRAEFYNNSWSYDKCENFSIFVSQSAYPLKGLHQLLKSLPLILKRFPDTKVYIAGFKMINRGYKTDGYGKYINSLIKKYRLSTIVNFTGELNEVEMCQMYIKSNVFVLPSSIENSPNSIGEAQILGLPVVASYVGGVPDMIENGKTGYLYRFEDFEFLAELVCKVFENGVNNMLSTNEKKISSKRHDSNYNAKELINIYSSILSL